MVSAVDWFGSLVTNRAGIHNIVSRLEFRQQLQFIWFHGYLTNIPGILLKNVLMRLLIKVCLKYYLLNSIHDDFILIFM